ncbi:Crp/Fnr family transcriptional regulator [Spongiactinospora sp. 9N601]|uniref:Crp/Fnr family transcriptional regulator n=1 Tax=Spongiactinospora sp. 9N601 TaxID=3375149 RepID=UPI0037B3CD7A
MKAQQSSFTARGWSDGTFLARLPKDARHELLELGVKQWHPAGCEFITQGGPPGAVYILLDAVVTVTACVENGVKTLIAIRVSGDLVGEMAVIDDTSRFASVTVCRDSLLSHIPGPAFMGFLHRTPAGAVAVHRLLGERLRQANRRRLDFAGYPVNVRLARALLELAAQHGRAYAGGVDIGVRLSQAEYGALVGATEDSVQRALRGLAAEGLIKRGRRRIVIVDRDRLTEYAELAQ